MKVGDMIKFYKTGAIAMIIEIANNGDNEAEYVSIYVSDGTLDNTPSADGFTYMSYKMLSRVAEVVSEGR
jgi:hypothetical protein